MRYTVLWAAINVRQAKEQRRICEMDLDRFLLAYFSGMFSIIQLLFSM